MSKRLDGKIALVTGAGSGIGEACSRRFAEEGASIVVTDQCMEQAERVAADIKRDGGEAQAFQLDVTEPECWQELKSQLSQQESQITVMVNNAGIAIPGTTEDCSYEDWQKTHRVNLDGVFLGTQLAIQMMAEKGGSIINISSVEGIVGNPGLAAYNASKGGVRIFTKAAALECCQKGYPVRINSVHPGLVQTSLIEKTLSQLSEQEGQALLSSLADKTPMGRLGEPVEIANVCLFLASDESSYVTGSELVVDGGYTAQ